MGQKRVLWVLVLLTSLRVAFAAGAAERTCCDWTESAEWPLEAPHCPASLDGANATYCCGLCYAPHRCPFDEAWLHQQEEEEEECPAGDQDEYLGEEHLAATSGSPSKESFWDTPLIVSLPALLVIIFICTWLCLKNEQETPEEDAVSFSGSTSSFVHSQLRSRYLPSRYGACSVAAPVDSIVNLLVPQNSPSSSAETDIPFCQATSEMPVVEEEEEEEEEVSLSPPTALQEESVSEDAPELVLFHQATSEMLEEEEEEEEEVEVEVSLSSLQEEPVSGDALEPVSGDVPEPVLFHQATSEMPEEVEVSLSTPVALQEEAISGDAPEPVSGDTVEPTLPTE